MGSRSFLEEGLELNLIDLSRWSPSPYFNGLENIPGKCDRRLTPATSISLKFPQKAHSGARSIWCDGWDKLVFFKDNYLRQFTEPGYLRIS